MKAENAAVEMDAEEEEEMLYGHKEIDEDEEGEQLIDYEEIDEDELAKGVDEEEEEYDEDELRSAVYRADLVDDSRVC